MSKFDLKKKKGAILALVLVLLIIAVIIFAVIRSNSGDDDTEVSDSNTSTDSEETEDAGEYATYLSDGTKINTSSKLNETKTLGGLEITDIQLTESDNATQLLATVTNTSDETDGGYVAIITLLDEDGETLVELRAYIPELEAGEDTQLNTSAGFDYANAYDFTIEKQ